MKVSELISQLTELMKKNGDLEVLITDGCECNCYSGEYLIAIFNDNDKSYIDIGIGGMMS